MLTKEEAQRIAAAVNILRPDWSTNGLMSVLVDDRCRKRPVKDLTLAFVALALDSTTRKPTRIYEHGHWWEILAPRVGPTGYKAIDKDTCYVCGFVGGWFLHEGSNHAFENPLVKKPSVKPTTEQRAAIDKAIADAEYEAKAAREVKADKQRRSVEEILAAHQPEAIEETA